MLYQLFTNTKNKTNRHRFTTTTPQDLHKANETMKNSNLPTLDDWEAENERREKIRKSSRQKICNQATDNK